MSVFHLTLPKTRETSRGTLSGTGRISRVVTGRGNETCTFIGVYTRLGHVKVGHVQIHLRSEPVEGEVTVKSGNY